MSRYSGVVLDFYDDMGATLKDKWPDLKDLPPTIKTASVTPKDDVPDGLFAMVALDSGAVLKKYACDNAGTTAMSVAYFLEHGEKLPGEARVKTAQNLVVACQRYDTEPPYELIKQAGPGFSAVRSLMKAEARLPGLSVGLQKALPGAALGAVPGAVAGFTQSEEGHGLGGALGGAVAGGVAGGLVGGGIGAAGARKALGADYLKASPTARYRNMLSSTFGGARKAPWVQKAKTAAFGTPPRDPREGNMLGALTGALENRVQETTRAAGREAGQQAVHGAVDAFKERLPEVEQKVKETLKNTVGDLGGKIPDLAEQAGRRGAEGLIDEGSKRINPILESAGDAVRAHVRALAYTGGLGGVTGALTGYDDRRKGAVGGALGGVLGGAVAPAFMRGGGLPARLVGSAVGGGLGGFLAGGGGKEMFWPGNTSDITGKTATPQGVTKRASMYMFEKNGSQKFPIDSWDQVKKAESYLLENGIRMDRPVYRNCSVKLAARAKDLGFPLAERIKEAGATGYAPRNVRAAALGFRKQAGADPDFLNELMVKSAELEPSMYVEVLRRFDIHSGLDRAWGTRVPDPWESTFGIAKEASVVWQEGADRVTDHELLNLGHNRGEILTDKFTCGFAREFQKDPIGIFKSLPLPEKRLVARLAADAASDGHTMGPVPDAPPVTKEAALGMSDIEDDMGLYLPDSKEQTVRDLIAKQEQQRFPLRHPWLTGIPTLGIAPAISKANAVEDIKRQLLRSDPTLAAQVDKNRAEEWERQMAEARLDVERSRAEQAQRVAATASQALLSAASIYGRRRAPEEGDEREEEDNRRTASGEAPVNWTYNG